MNIPSPHREPQRLRLCTALAAALALSACGNSDDEAVADFDTLSMPSAR